MPTNFTVPKKGEVYINYIKERASDLINYGVWTGIELHKIPRWFNNFESPEEKYFAACILDSLIYRSPQQTQALAFELLYRELPGFLTRNGFINVGTDTINWVRSLGNFSTNLDLRFVATIRDTDPPTKSSHSILRILKRDFGINENFTIYPSQIE
ncbi:MAG: hypothetical protein EOP53_09985, partial [Sphingobacteriales bacterium]